MVKRQVEVQEHIKFEVVLLHIVFGVLQHIEFEALQNNKKKVYNIDTFFGLLN